MSGFINLIEEYFNDTGNYDLLLEEYVGLVSDGMPSSLKFSKELNKQLRKEKRELKEIFKSIINGSSDFDLVPTMVSASLKYIKFRHIYNRFTPEYVKWVLGREKGCTREEMVACHFLGEVIERGEKEYVSKIMPFIHNLTRLETGMTIPPQPIEGLKKMIANNYFFYKKFVKLTDIFKEAIGEFISNLYDEMPLEEGSVYIQNNSIRRMKTSLFRQFLGPF